MLDHILASSSNLYLATSNDLLCDARHVDCLRRCVYYGHDFALRSFTTLGSFSLEMHYFDIFNSLMLLSLIH